jgi:hypothetical protein
LGFISGAGQLGFGSLGLVQEGGAVLLHAYGAWGAMPHFNNWGGTAASM